MEFQGFTVSLEGLQSNIISSFSNLVEVVKASKKTLNRDVVIDMYDLERAIDSIRNDVVMVSALVDPETGRSALDEDTEIPYWEADEEE